MEMGTSTDDLPPLKLPSSAGDGEGAEGGAAAAAADAASSSFLEDMDRLGALALEGESMEDILAQQVRLPRSRGAARCVPRPITWRTHRQLLCKERRRQVHARSRPLVPPACEVTPARAARAARAV